MHRPIRRLAAAALAGLFAAALTAWALFVTLLYLRVRELGAPLLP